MGSSPPPRKPDKVIMPDEPADRAISEAPIPPPPVHPLSALATIALDGVWGAIDIVALPAIFLTSIAVGVLCFFAVLGIQRSVAKDDMQSAVSKALVMAILAGVPFPVTGTAAGAFLLGWAGLSGLSRLGSGK
jgi:hypothetical protein